MTLLWSAVLSIAVIFLIYKEHTAILYILCTLGVAVLMIIVAFSDLAHEDGKGPEVTPETSASGVASRER